MKEQLNEKKLLLLDRDGVINLDSDDYIKSEHEWQAIPGSLEAMAKLSQLDIDIIIVTNQSGIGRGFFDKNTLDSMHKKMQAQLEALGGEIKAIYFCPHLPDDHCDCRKPKTGMLDKIENDFNVSLKNVPYIGDTKKDIDLAKRKSCLPILVRTGKGDKAAQYFSQQNDGLLIFNDLFSAGDYLIAHVFSGN